MDISKKDKQHLNKVVDNLVDSMRVEGTNSNPRKFTIVEVTSRVAQAFLISPNDKFESYVCEIVLDKLRNLKRIKNAISNYNFAQTLLAYKVLSNVDENALVGSLYKNGKWSITLTSEEHKQFCEYVNVPTKDTPRYTFVKGTDENAPSCSFSSNFGKIEK
jgi:hypothetical protein